MLQSLFVLESLAGSKRGHREEAPKKRETWKRVGGGKERNSRTGTLQHRQADQRRRLRQPPASKGSCNLILVDTCSRRRYKSELIQKNIRRAIRLATYHCLQQLRPIRVVRAFPSARLPSYPLLDRRHDSLGQLQPPNPISVVNPEETPLIKWHLISSSCRTGYLGESTVLLVLSQMIT